LAMRQITSPESVASNAPFVSLIRQQPGIQWAVSEPGRSPTRWPHTAKLPAASAPAKIPSSWPGHLRSPCSTSPFADVYSLAPPLPTATAKSGSPACIGRPSPFACRIPTSRKSTPPTAPSTGSDAYPSSGTSSTPPILQLIPSVLGLRLALSRRMSVLTPQLVARLGIPMQNQFARREHREGRHRQSSILACLGKGSKQPSIRWPVRMDNSMVAGTLAVSSTLGGSK
jgi:hypothetical protein